MKKLATLILAAGMVFGATTGAKAIDFKAKGQWLINFALGKNGNFMGGYGNHYQSGSHYGNNSADQFEVNQRFRVQLDAVASESLSGSLWFEIGGPLVWGRGSQGGALGTDGNIVKVKGAWIDWMIPDTDAKIRMGLQHVTLPSFTLGGSSVMDDDVAGITASYQFNENVGVTAIWMRPANDNYGGWTNDDYPGQTFQANYQDNMDLGALLIPMTFDGAKVTPWGMYGAIGPNTFRNKNSNDPLGNWASNGGGEIKGGLFPVGGARHRNFDNANGARKLSTYGNAWWGGITGEVTIWDPFRLAYDFVYGSVTWEDDGRLNKQGWMASLLAEYKLDWATPGLYGWYASGDDNNPANGSEQLPTISENNSNKFSDFAFTGHGGIYRRGLINKGGMSGTWGIGARLKDMSFIDDIKTTIKVNLIGGTNSPSMGKKMSKAGLWFNGTTLDNWNSQPPLGPDGGTTWGYNWGTYMTTMDYALEFGISNSYKMYENFTVNLDFDYIAYWLDTSSSVWGARHRNPVGSNHIPSVQDAWNISCNFAYNF